MITITVQSRPESGKQLGAQRRLGVLPAIIYGHGLSNTSVSIRTAELERLLRSEDASRLFSVQVEGGEMFPVLLKDLQRHPITGLPTHIDFHRVRTDEKITAEVALRFIGEAPAVKSLMGNLVRNMDHLKVSCLPTDLVSHIDVDISSLVTFDNFIHVRDLQVPATLTVLDHTDEVVATVVPAEEEKAEEVVSEAEQIAKIAGVVKEEKEPTEDKDSGERGKGKKE